MPTFLKSVKLLSSSEAASYVPNFVGLLLRNKWKFLMGWSISLTRVLLGSIGSLYVIGIYRFSKFCTKTIRCNGVKFLVQRLKALQMMLMQVAAGHPHPKPLGGQRFRRSNGGFPSIVPVEHRRAIRLGNPKVMSFWMSLFGFYRVLVYPGKVSLGTVVLPGKDFSFYREEIRESFYSSLRSLHREVGLPKAIRPESWDDAIVLENLKDQSDVRSPRTINREGLIHTLFPIFKSSPSPWTRSVTEEGKGDTHEGLKPEVAHGWYALINQSKALTSPKNGPVFEAFKLYASITGNIGLVNIVRMFSTYLYPASVDAPIGRLSEIQEAAGKVRIVALLDPFTQWLLYPLHDAFFSLFKKISTDGCHDQTRPLLALMSRLEEKGLKNVYSFDLSAATDRLPIIIQEDILAILLNPSAAKAWRDLLSQRDFLHRACLNPNYEGKKEFTEQLVRYRVGQPMGAYSSWAMLNITHHLLVQWSYHRAFEVSPDMILGTDWFQDYAVLGDDIVIGNKRVADEYLGIMELLGVPINMSKSLISNNGSAEFAKRFILRYKDASPISFKELLVARHALSVALELCKKVLRFRKESISILLDIFGRGYRSKSTITGNISGLGKVASCLVLGWLTREDEFSIVPLLQKSLYCRKEVVKYNYLRRALFGMVSDSLKAARIRVAPFGYMSNYMGRIADQLNDVPHSKLGRFIFRTRFHSVLYDKFYALVPILRTKCMRIEHNLEQIMRKALWSYPCTDMSLTEYTNLVEDKQELDDLRAGFPRDLNSRDESTTLRLWPSRVTFAYSLRPRTKRFHNRTKRS